MRLASSPKLIRNTWSKFGFEVKAVHGKVRIHARKSGFPAPQFPLSVT